MSVEARAGRGFAFPRPVESKTRVVKRNLTQTAMSAKEAFLDFVDLSRTPEAGGGNGEILLGPKETPKIVRQIQKALKDSDTQTKPH